MRTDHEIFNSRLLKATPENVFRAIENPEILALWWGPEGFGNDIQEFDFTEGGNWKMDMIAPDGTRYPQYLVVEKITEGAIVLRCTGEADPFTLTITITPENGGTRIGWSLTFDSPEDFEKAREYLPDCLAQQLDRLAIELAVMAPGELDLVFCRIIDGPSEKVYQGWTDAEMIVKWFTPAPWKTVSAKLDVRPGGSSFILMRGPDGTEIPKPGVYLEVVPGKRLVITDAYSEAWKPSAKPFATIDLNFEDLGGKTKYTAIVRHWTKEDREAHEKMGFQTGWGAATDQLEDLIKTTSD